MTVSANPTDSLMVLNQAALAKRVGEMSARVLTEADVVQAVAAADGAARLVIATAEEAAYTADRKKTIRVGQRRIEAWRKKLLEFPKALDKAIRDAVRSEDAALLAAYEALGRAETNWMLAERKRVTEAEAAARAEAARIAQEAVAADPQDDTPEASIAPQAAPTIARGGSATSVLVERKCIALVDASAYAAVNPDGLQLTAAASKALLGAYQTPDFARPPGAVDHPDGGFVLNGVRYYLEAGSSTR